MRLQINHITVYRYSQEVNFGPHRLMVRPREGHDLTIESSRLEIFPAHQLRWCHDVQGNSVAFVNFIQPAAELRIFSEVVVKQFESNPFNFILEPYASQYPFRYESLESPDIAPYLQKLYPEDTPPVREWLSSFYLEQPIPTLDLLTSLNQTIHRQFQYRRREEPGVQSPAETLALRGGSCRDYATLFMEACRHLGIAARFVSGYLHEPNGSGEDHGSTHAWAEAYLPGAGWKGFDPTGGILACHLHVPVAVSRLPGGASPVSGSFSTPGACLGLHVTVRVEDLS